MIVVLLAGVTLAGATDFRAARNTLKVPQQLNAMLEPASLALLGVGLLAIARRLRKGAALIAVP
jgi:hypothetical protein